MDRRDGDVYTGFSDEVSVHVLAVDDSLVDRKVIERLLTITSCKVTAVDSGIRALQFLGLGEEEEEEEEEEDTSAGFHDLKVDLIITDYCMPEMSGYELLKKIKGSSTFREIPVVIMSSENILARIDRCLEEGAEDFIVKPVKLSDVERLKTSMFSEWGRKVRDEESIQLINSDAASILDVSSGPTTSSQCSTPTSSPSRPSSPMLVDSPNNIDGDSLDVGTRT